VTYHLASVDWSFTERPSPSSATMHGLSRSVLVGPAEGAIHTELAVGGLGPGGWLQRHFHSFEEALYVLAGALLLEIDGHVHRLARGDYALMPVGTWHALANGAAEEVRWLSVNTPQRLAPDAGRRDTFFASAPFDPDAFAERAERPAFGDPRLRLVGHYEGPPAGTRRWSCTAGSASRCWWIAYSAPSC
jgi:quercetin dioxygenase-like cupin family protein